MILLLNYEYLMSSKKLTTFRSLDNDFIINYEYFKKGQVAHSVYSIT